MNGGDVGGEGGAKYYFQPPPPLLFCSATTVSGKRLTLSGSMLNFFFPVDNCLALGSSLELKHFKQQESTVVASHNKHGLSTDTYPSYLRCYWVARAL